MDGDAVSTAGRKCRRGRPATRGRSCRKECVPATCTNRHRPEVFGSDRRCYSTRSEVPPSRRLRALPGLIRSRTPSCMTVYGRFSLLSGSPESAGVWLFRHLLDDDLCSGCTRIEHLLKRTDERASKTAALRPNGSPPEHRQRPEHGEQQQQVPTHTAKRTDRSVPARRKRTRTFSRDPLSD